MIRNHTFKNVWVGPNKEELVIISEEEFPVKISLAYATKENITGSEIYKNPICALHPEAAQKLMNAALYAQSAGYMLIIFDAYRPYEAQERLWAFLPDDKYISNPYTTGSNHTRGVAVDLGLLDSNGCEIAMGTGFDEMTDLSHMDSPDLPTEFKKNRLLLMGIMLHAGFKEIKYEWWHFQLPNSNIYPFIKSDLIGVN